MPPLPPLTAETAQPQRVLWGEIEAQRAGPQQMVPAVLLQLLHVRRPIIATDRVPLHGPPLRRHLPLGHLCLRPGARHHVLLLRPKLVNCCGPARLAGLPLQVIDEARAGQQHFVENGQDLSPDHRQLLRRVHLVPLPGHGHAQDGLDEVVVPQKGFLVLQGLASAVHSPLEVLLVIQSDELAPHAIHPPAQNALLALEHCPPDRIEEFGWGLRVLPLAGQHPVDVIIEISVLCQGLLVELQYGQAVGPHV
eukprot:CAMPEP_0174378902 /NCGR_PEP_ID=MMETSP0811_2-20130205/122353_1 /TAXON_ID=73025 ORGANISM="Eutreptiella gymnastica-like, Strain CCMP1594" /NCGR_SAMPLE_ID=MMETSP0811_2 /ASSEMBLY_ACC=CAM_ASM_000667 /LENGTH=250 /DNA_ID=CAMNT_0015531261 /DNA_START=2233 /DNA_END=2986 /DNA_ORIENTATION=+